MLFIFKTLQYPSCACVRNILKIVTFVTGKVKLVSFSLFLDASPIDPRCPLVNDTSLLTYTTYVKGVLGLGGGKRGCRSQRRYQTFDIERLLYQMVVFIEHQLYKNIYSIVIDHFFYLSVNVNFTCVLLK